MFLYAVMDSTVHARAAEGRCEAQRDFVVEMQAQRTRPESPSEGVAPSHVLGSAGSYTASSYRADRAPLHGVSHVQIIVLPAVSYA